MRRNNFEITTTKVKKKIILSAFFLFNAIVTVVTVVTTVATYIQLLAQFLSFTSEVGFQNVIELLNHSFS